MSPTRRVIAFVRRGLVLLGAVDEEGDPYRVIAEGGGIVQVPSEHVLRTMAEAAPSGTPKEVGRDLRKARLECEERLDVELLWESAPIRSDPIPLDEMLALWFGEPTDEGTLVLVRSLEEALPWFTPEAGGLRRNSRESVEEEARRRENERRAREAEAAVVDWFRDGASGDAPEGSGDLLDELRRLALKGSDGASKRSIRVARSLGCPEPDDVLELLEDGGLVELHVDAGPDRHRVAVAFPDGLTASDADLEGREDLTDLFTFALDDPDTVEVDDALSYEETDEGIRLHVHIADAETRIPLHGPLDEVAASRGRTVYEPDRRIAMLPPDVVAALSLEEGLVRPAVTGTFLVAPDGEVLSTRFRRTLVRVDRRAGYDVGEDILGPLAVVGESLRRRRVEQGAICLDLPDAKIVVDDGVPRIKVRRPDTPADHVVAEAAVLYNVSAASHLAAAGVAAVFRSQAPLLEELPAADDPLRVPRARRLLPPAASDVTPSRHGGIAADAYLMVTSPIRRYVDLIHQRQLVALLRGEPPPYGIADLSDFIETVRTRDRAARMVEAERTSYWLGRLLQTRLGEVLNGLVSRTMPGGRAGVWVEEFLREFTLRLPKGHRVAEGEPIAVRLDKVRPRRGSVHLSLANPPE